MATQSLSSYLNNINKKRKAAFKGFESSSSNSVSKQNANYKKRLDSIGEDADSRNFIEKALNLPEDQNALFDVGEILSRPQQALFGAINNAINGDNVLTGLKEGITGETKTSGGEILRNVGIGNDKNGSAELKDPSTWGIDDILGTAADIVLDPMNLVTAGAAKAVSGAGKLAKGADVVSDAGKILGKLDDAGKVVNASGKAVGYLDTANDVFKPIGKDLTQRAFEATGKYIGKPLTKLADKGISKALQGVDAINGIKYANSGADLVQDLGKILPDGIKEGTNVKGALELYKEAKTGIKDAFNFSKSLPSNVWNKLKNSEGKGILTQLEATSIGKNIEKTINDYAAVKNIDASVLNRQLALLTEDGLDKTTNVSKIINNFKNGVENGVVRVADVDKVALTNTLDQLKGIKGLNYKIIDGGDIKITSVNNNILKSNPDLVKNLDNITFNKRIDLPEEDLKLLNAAKSDPELLKLYKDKIQPSYKQVADVIKKNTGVDFNPVVDREGYLRRTVNEDALQKSDIIKKYGSGKPKMSKEFATRKYENQAATNLAKEDVPRETIKHIENAINKKTSELSSVKLGSLESKKVNILKSIDDTKTKLTTKLNNLDEKSANILKNTATKEQQKIAILNELNKKNIKSYSKIADETQMGNLIKYSSQSEKYSEEMSSILKQLDDKNLSNNRMKQLIDKLDSTNAKLVKSENDTYKLMEELESLKTKEGLSSVKRTVESFSESNSLTAKITKNNAKLGEIAKAKELTQAAADDMIKLKNQQINLLNSKITSVDPTKDAVILNQIQRMKKDIEYLSNKDVKELFNINYTESLFDFINTSTKQSNSMMLMNDVLFDTAMNDSTLVRTALAGEKAPLGYVKMSSKAIIDEMEKWGDVFKTDSVKNFIENFKGSDIIIDKKIANMINPIINPTTSNTLLNVVDKVNNTFKKYKTLSFGFQARNLVGGSTNMMLAGIPANVAMPFSKAQTKSLNILKNAQNLIDKSANGLLRGTEISDYKLLSQFVESGFFNSTSKLYDIEDILNKSSKNIVGKQIDKLAKLNNNLNQYVDGMYKMTLMDYFNKNPEALVKSGYNSSTEAVKGILFSPSATDLSPFERNTMKRIIPFYTFTKQNLMFQLTNSLKNPAKYKQLIKATNKIYDNIFDEGEYAEWGKEGFLLPLPFEDANGNNIVIKLNLPLSDLGEYMSNPLGRLVSATSPMIKAPFELVSGKDMFTGADLKKDSATDLVDLFGKYSGLDVFTSQPKKIKNLVSGEQSGMQNLATLVPSLALYNDRGKNVTNNEYNQLEKYQAKVKELKKQGVEVPTVTELNKNKSATVKAKLILKQLEKIRKNT